MKGKLLIVGIGILLLITTTFAYDFYYDEENKTFVFEGASFMFKGASNYMFNTSSNSAFYGNVSAPSYGTRGGIFQETCSGTQKVSGVANNGSLVCTADVAGSSGNVGWTTLANIVYNDTASIQIGIGTSTPPEKLSVVGNLNVSALTNTTNLNVNGLMLLGMNITGFNYTTNYVLFAGNSINVSGLVNSTQLFVFGTDVTLNLSRVNISTTLLNDRLVSFNISATAMNDRLVSFNTSATAMNDRLVSFNTSATAMNDRLVLFNTSATNLDARQRNDNQSVARTNVGNIFTENQFITGNLNVSGLINVTNLIVTNRIGIGMNILLSNNYRLAVGGDVNVTGIVNASLFVGNLSKPTASIHGGVRATSCSGTDKVTGISTEGVVACGTDATGGGGSANESGINRSLSIVLASANSTFSVPVLNGWGIITIEGWINGSTSTQLMGTFNGDNQTNYALARLTGATLVSTTAAANFQLETTANTNNRSITIKIFNPTAQRGVIGGEYTVTNLESTSATAPVQTSGRLQYMNRTQATGLTSIVIRPGLTGSFNPTSWVIVKGEKK